MMGRQASFEILKKALHYSSADQAQVSLVGEDLSLTRFANSSIHQNLARRKVALQVKVVLGKKIGIATTNNLDDNAIRQTVQNAQYLASLQEENVDFVSLPPATALPHTHNYYEETASYTPEQRAKDIGEIVSQCQRAGAYHAYGAHTTGIEEVALMNSLGVQVYDKSTSAYLRTVIMSEDSTGYADQLSRNVAEIDPVAVGVEALTKARNTHNARALPTGEYEVIFEPYAVADLVRFLAYLGFGAQSVQEGRSFMADKFGQQITGPQITLWDDGLDVRTLNMPFDAEGVAKQRVNLITKGVAEGVVYDAYTAHKEGKKSTGHARSDRRGEQAMVSNMIMQNGTSNIEEMIKNTDKGIFVTRFHYTHCPDPQKVIMTGTTRDGTFYIENGAIKYPVKNMRLTDSVLRIFEHVELISQETKLQRDWWSTFTSVLPALRASSCMFTGATSY